MYYNNQLLRDLALSDDNIESLRKALAKQKDPNRIYPFGYTLLHIAAGSVHDNPGIVQELINAGVDVSILDNLGHTALHHAVIGRKRKVVDVLLQTAIPINQKNHRGRTALHYAINKNLLNTSERVADMYIVRKLLDHRLISVDETDNYEQTPLVLAININHFEIAKMLLNRNARVDTFHSFRKTPLQLALSLRNQRIVVALLLKQASLLEMGRYGETPLNIIINSQSVKFARTCLNVIAFNYSLKELLTDKIKHFPALYQFLNECWKEIDYMKSDFIVKELSVFDFFSKCPAKHRFHDPIAQIYKPVVEKLLTGKYPVYIGYILNRMSKSTLYSVLDVYIDEVYCNDSCAMEYLTEFSKIIRIRLLFEYLSNENIFCLFVAFTDEIEREYLLNFHEHEWYLTDLWDVYPDDHFR